MYQIAFVQQGNWNYMVLLITDMTSKTAQKVIFVTIAGPLIILIVISLIVVSLRKQPATPEGTITVAASIFPLTDITKAIGGEFIHVVQILPPGASPHSYTISPQQAITLQQARTLFAIGHGLDEWATEGVARVSEADVVVVDSNIGLKPFEEAHKEHEGEEDEHASDGLDPHYWLSIPNAKEIAKTITEKLSTIDSDHSDQYKQNLDTYLTQLDAAEAELQALATQAPNKHFIAVHNAWSYFAQQYGLELVATYEPVEGREPSIRDIEQLQNIVKQYDIATFFTEPEKQSAGAARFFENDLGLTIRVLDPIGGVGTRDSYINMMKENLRAIVGG